MAATTRARRRGTTNDPVEDVLPPLEFDRRYGRPAARSDKRFRERMAEADSDEFADLVQAYAHEHGLSPDDVLDAHKERVLEDKPTDPELQAFLDKNSLGAGEKNSPGKGDGAAGGHRADQRAGRGAVAPSRPARHHLSDGSSFLLGVLGYAVAVNWIGGGPAQVKDWLAAKFLNKVNPQYQAPPTVSEAVAYTPQTSNVHVRTAGGAS